MGASRKCTICSHPARSDAEAAVASGVSVRGAAKQFNVPYQSFDRHVRGCIKQAVALAHATREITHGGKILDRVEELQAVTADVLSEARKAKDGQLALKAVAVARKNLELIARLTGELDPAEDTGRQTVTLEEVEMILLRARRGSVSR